jgi:hypothetical protein
MYIHIQVLSEATLALVGPAPGDAAPPPPPYPMHGPQAPGPQTGQGMRVRCRG